MACEDVLTSADLAIKSQAATIEMLTDQNQKFREAVEQGRKAIKANEPKWYDSPWLYFTLGAAAGVMVMKK